MFNAQGQVVTQAHVDVSTQTPENNWVEHDSKEMLASVRQAISEAIETLGTRRYDIVAAGLATQRSSICCWDKVTGQTLSPIISWQDRRHSAWLSRQTIDPKDVHRRTGLMLSPHYGASKIRWCLDNITAVKQALHKGRLTIGPLASFLVFHLLKQQPLVADPANASRTLLWNLASKQWDDTLLELFGIPLAILPRCTQSQHYFGDLVVEDLSIPLTVLTGDQPAALFAWGKPKQNTTYINMGSGAFLQRPLSSPLKNKRLLSGIAYLGQDPQTCVYTLEGTVNGAARALQWLGIDGLEDNISTWLDEIEQPALFLNSVAGIGSPYWGGDFAPCFIGDGCAAAKAVAVAESIVFLLQRNLDEMAHYLPSSEQIIISGGLANIAPLCQRLADLSGRLVKRPEASEATACGLAFLVANQPQNWPKPNGRCFSPQANLALKQRYSDWRAKLEQKLSETAGEEMKSVCALPTSHEKKIMPPPILIAHRGYAKRYPENTLIALEAALTAGACCVEFDVQLTQDRVPVVLHDANLKRTTGVDKLIFDMDSIALANLSIKTEKTGLKKFTEVGIPTLADVIELLKKWPCARAFVEIKQESLDHFSIEKVIKRLALECEPVIDRCVLIARSELALRCARAMGFNAVGWILSQYNDEAKTVAAGLAPDYLLCNHTKLPKDIKQVWSGPWQWAFYEVTQAKLALKLSKLGVKFVETMAVAEMLKNSSLRSMSCVEE